MSRFHNRNFELLEPYDAKVSRTVLRGEGSSNAPDLLDIFLDNPAETFQQFEKRTRNLQSLSRYSRANQINKEWLDQFLNEGHSRGLTPVRCHCNVLAWSDDAEQLKRIKSDVGSQLATMECKPRHNTVDVPALFWAGKRLPGRGKFLYLPGTSPVLFRGGNELPGFAVAVRNKNGGPDYG